MYRLPLELEPVHLEHLVARPQLAAPLGRASFHHTTDDHTLSLVAYRRTLEIELEFDSTQFKTRGWREKQY